MNGFTEKKWFVYLGDHHEGPFSLEEIQSKMNQGQLTATNYVWAEGMSDWKVMSQVDAFESIFMPAAPPPQAIFVEAPQTAEAQQVVEVGVSQLSPALAMAGPSSDFAAVSIEPSPTIQLSAVNESSAPELIEPAPVAAEISQEDAPPEVQELRGQKKALLRSMAKVATLLIFLGVMGIAYNDGYLTPLLNSRSVQSVTDKLSDVAQPLLSRLGFSPIPKLDDVDPEEYEQLKTAAKANLSQVGPQFAIAVAKGDLLSPTFYVATNLPDGAILDLYVEGIPDSLLNQLSLNAKTQVTISKKFGRTASIALPPGIRVLARGQYQLFIVDPGTQPQAVKDPLARASAVQTIVPPVSVPKGLKVLFTKSYFLGGLKDATYTQRLQEFHQQITTKAQSEITELKQVAATLDSKLDETNKKFASLRKGRHLTPRQKKAWKAYDAQWTGLFGQLAQMFSKLNPDTIKNDYFYGFLYQLCQQTTDSLNQLHVLQSTYFTTGVQDPKAYEIQLGEVSAIAKNAIDVLKSKIDQVAAEPPTPNGLPKRDPI